MTKLSDRIKMIAVVILCVIARPTQAAELSDDRKAILGVWKGGMPGDPHGSIELTITPTRITGRDARTGKSLGEGTYDIDPSAKTIDSRGVEAPVRARTYLGIYSLDGNTLRWCSQSRSKKRPVDLKHRPDRDQFLMVLTRQSGGSNAIR